MKLTKLEREVLISLFESAEGNGHDFGFTNEHGLSDRKQAGGVIASLVRKGIINGHPQNSGSYGVQFTWKLPVSDVEALLR